MIEEKPERKLQVMETKIGEMKGVYDGVYRTFEVYYGNALSPVLNGEMLHLSFDDYEKMLMEFLSSDEGKQYEKPDEQEIVNTAQDVISSSRQVELRRKEEALESEKEELYQKESAFHEDIRSELLEIRKILDEELSRQRKAEKRRWILAAVLLVFELITLILIVILLFKTEGVILPSIFP